MTDLVARLRIETSAGNSVQETAKVEAGLAKLRPAGALAKTGFDQAAAGATNFERTAGGADRAARLVAAAIAGLSIKAFTADISDAAFKSQGFTTGLTAVAGGARSAGTEQAFLRTESERLGLVVQNQVQGFMGLAGATNGTALAGAETREIWLGLAEAGTALNRTAEQQGRALEATAQIASKGTLSMEELRGQLSEAIPGAMQIAARAMGMTTAQLNKLVGEGKVASEDFLPKFAAELRRTFGPTLEEAMNTPLGQARKELAATKSSIFDLQTAAGGDFLGAATSGIAAFNAQLSSADTEQAARRLGASLGEGAALAANGAALLVENIDAVVFATQMLTGVAVVRWLAGLTVEARKAAVAVMEKAAAQLAAAKAADLEAQANLKSATTSMTYTQRANAAAVAARNLAVAQSSTAAASIGMRGALGSVVGFLGGPWGIAFLAAGAAVALVSGKMAQAEADAATLQRGLDTVDEGSRRTADASRDLAAGLDLASASANQAARASRNHTQALLEEEKAAVAAALAVAQKNVQSARARTTDVSPERWAHAESVDGGAGFVQAQQKAEQDLFRAELQLDKLLAYNNKIQQDASSRSRGVGGERTRIGRDKAGVEDAPDVITTHEAVADAADKRTKKTKEVREAEQQLARANDLTDKLKIDTELQKQRAIAVVLGAQAMEDLQVKEAGLQALQQIGVTSLTQLTGAQRKAAEAAMAAAEAYERQSIATQKVERVANATKDLDRRIASETARTIAITGGVRASLDYAKAEAVRQAVERAGENLTADQIEQIRTKVELLMQVEAVNDNATAAKYQAEELELLTLTNREREIEIRARQKAIELQRENVLLTDEEAKVRARIIAMQDVNTEERLRAIGELRDGVRTAFIESGEIGFDQVAEYAKRRLREAVYDALLAKPFDILINATIGGLGGLTGANGQGGLLGSILGAAVPGLGGTLGGLLGGAAMGTMAGQALGLGTGKKGTDAALGLGGAALGTMAASGGLLGGVGGALGMAGFQASLGLGASGVAAMGIGAMLSSAAVLGPLGAIAALAAGTLFKDDKRPYARSDIGVTDGKFGVVGGQALDKGPLDKTDQAADAIAQSLNAAADLFKLDLTKLSGNQASFGYVEGKNTGALGQGWFGGGGGGFSGAEFSGSKDPEKLAADIVKSTILKAIDMGASDLSEAEKNVVRQAADLEEAANKIAAARSITQSIDEAMLQLTNPAEFERKQALAAIEASYQAMKAQATELVAAGLVSGDIMAKLDALKALQIDEAMRRLGTAADDAAAKLKQSGDFKAEINEAFLKILDPAAYQQAKGVREINEQIEEMKGRAKGLIASGVVGPEVMGQLEALRNLQLSDLANQVEDTTAAFANAQKGMRSWLDQMRLSPSAELSPQAARDQALADYQVQLRKARGGDAEAASSITGYADRFFNADRAGNDNAQDRLANYNRIMADIQGLASMSLSAPSGNDALSAQMKLLGIPLDKLVLTSEQTKAANDDMVAAMAPSLAVSLANMPTLKAAYGEVAKIETDRVVAALDLLRADLKAGLAAIKDERSSNALQTALEAVTAALGQNAAANSELANRAWDQARESGITNALIRIRA